jgi:hypothetical protein
MAKAPKRTAIADSKPLQSTSHGWMPLTDAFLHIQQAVGGEQLAEEELRLRLESGDVEAQERRVTPGEGIDIIPLSPEDFKDGLLFPRVPELDGDINFLALLHNVYRRDKLLLRVDRYRLDGRNFFLRRADVYRIWPIAGDAEKPRQVALPTKRPKGVGPRAWLVAREADALMREGGEGSKWIDLDDLLKTIRERIGAKDKRVPSARTLDTALAFLRKLGLIDR